jgi:hypothetical protein
MYFSKSALLPGRGNINFPTLQEEKVSTTEAINVSQNVYSISPGSNGFI